MSEHENTFWRDGELSARHREWGFDCPAVDLDLLIHSDGLAAFDVTVFLEYDYSIPKALIEFKKASLASDWSPDSNVDALSLLASLGAIPFFIVFYDLEQNKFEVRPQNQVATKRWRSVMKYNELSFVRLLYKIRGRDVPKNIVEHIQRRGLK